MTVVTAIACVDILWRTQMIIIDSTTSGGHTAAGATRGVSAAVEQEIRRSGTQRVGMCQKERLRRKRRR